MQHHRGTFTLTKPELRALCGFASRDSTREHLNCVRLDPRRGRASATDGHSLLCYDVEAQARLSSFAVPLSMVQDAMALLRRKHQVLRVAVAGQRPQLVLKVFEDEDATEPLATLRAKRDPAANKGTGPEAVLALLPKTRGASAYALAPHLLGRLGLLSSIGCQGLQHRGAAGDALSPVYYTGLAGEVAVTVVIMPIRI